MKNWSDGVLGGAARSSTPTLTHSKSMVMFAMAIATDDAPLVRELKSLAGLKLKLAEPLARYTSMKIGGPADCFIEVENIAVLAATLELLHRFNIAVALLGNGSNVLAGCQ